MLQSGKEIDFMGKIKCVCKRWDYPFGYIWGTKT